MKKKIFSTSIIILLSLIAVPALAASVAERTKGKILLQVNENGEAWYVHPDSKQRYYMGDGDSAYGIMWSQNLGISNQDLSKISIGILDDSPNLIDTDGDGLDDKLEEAIGTNIDNIDSDGDGYSDKEEILSNNNPNGSGSINLDSFLTNRLSGKILLQVESHGEAWYVNPADNKRYYLKDGDTAYQMMSQLGLGITNEDLFTIKKGGNYIPYHEKLKTLTLDTFTIQYPLGWTTGYVFEAGNVSLQNFHEKTAKSVGDNVGEFTGHKIVLAIASRPFDQGELIDNHLLNNFEYIKTCSEQNETKYMIDGLEFYKCYESEDESMNLIRKMDDFYFSIEASYAHDGTLETINKVLQNINFL